MKRKVTWIPMAVLGTAVAAMLLHGPIAQPGEYHAFADRRAFLGLPNAGDVLSNAGFALVGLWGLAWLQRHGKDVLTGASRASYAVFFGAVALTALGSAFYHLSPDNARLVWDRLPIALACAGLLAAVHADTHRSSWERWLLPALACAAVASVAWWSITEAAGAGDLRPYLLIQGAPLVLIPLWQWLHGSPRATRVAFGIAIACYALAKVLELKDHAVFETVGIVSGHTLKHLLAVAAAAVLTYDVVRRR